MIKACERITIPVGSDGTTGQAGICLIFRGFVRHRTLAKDHLWMETNQLKLNLFHLESIIYRYRDYFLLNVEY